MYVVCVVVDWKCQTTVTHVYKITHVVSDCYGALCVVVYNMCCLCECVGVWLVGWFVMVYVTVCMWVGMCVCPNFQKWFEMCIIVKCACQWYMNEWLTIIMTDIGGECVCTNVAVVLCYVKYVCCLCEPILWYVKR